MPDKGQLMEQFDVEEPSRQSRESNVPGEHHYDSFFQYIMSIIGIAVGFGSFWRFPYLIYKNGGGAFLIPYLIAMVLIGMPLLYFETSLGQIHQRSIPFIYSRINKGLKLIGFTYLFISFHVAGYYNIILVYSYRFLLSAFMYPLPFEDESPFENKYFEEDILHQSVSIQQFGSIHPELLIIYILSLLICYFVIKNGVKTSGKIIVVTAMLPYFFFVILSIRGIFLEGAMTGLSYLFWPKFEALFKVQIWIDAVVQVFFQVTIAFSTIINISSLKPRREKFLKGIYLVPLSIILCGILCSISIFCYLGHFCYQNQLDINNLQLSGTSLSFNVFPKALAVLPWPNLWIFLFFLAMVFLGIDSEFGLLQAIFCCIKDQIKFNQGPIRVLNTEFTKERFQKLIIGLIMLFSPFLTSSAGIYYLQFFDNFMVTIPTSLNAVLECYFFIFLFPFSELRKQIQKYTGQPTPSWIAKLLEGKLIFSILIGNLVLNFFNQVIMTLMKIFKFQKYNLELYAFGWGLTIYPYLIAYIYWLRNKEDQFRLTYDQVKDL